MHFILIITFFTTSCQCSRKSNRVSILTFTKKIKKTCFIRYLSIIMQLQDTSVPNHLYQHTGGNTMKNNDFETENSLTEAIHRLARSLRRKTPTTPRASHGYIRLLSLINEHDGSSSSELADLMDIRPSSLTEMLGYLESDGMIRRQRGENDLRVVRVYIESIGREHLEKIEKTIDDDYLDILTSQEKISLMELCNKLSQGLNNRMPSDDIVKNRQGHHNHSGHKHHPHDGEGHFHKDHGFCHHNKGEDSKTNDAPRTKGE